MPLFSPPEVHEALQSVASIERSLPNLALGPRLGFDVIKGALRRGITGNPEELRKAISSTGYPIGSLVIILARNYVWDELASGKHMVFSELSMSGTSLLSLDDHLTDLLESAGTESPQEARAQKRRVRDMLRERFGP
jgi:hypothetical protein